MTDATHASAETLEVGKRYRTAYGDVIVITARRMALGRFLVISARYQADETGYEIGITDSLAPFAELPALTPLTSP